VPSQGEPPDAAVNFDRYRILQQHRAVSLPQHGFLVYAYISDRSTADITQRRPTPIFTAVTQNHGDSRQGTPIISTHLYSVTFVHDSQLTSRSRRVTGPQHVIAYLFTADEVWTQVIVYGNMYYMTPPPRVTPANIRMHTLYF